MPRLIPAACATGGHRATRRAATTSAPRQRRDSVMPSASLFEGDRYDDAHLFIFRSTMKATGLTGVSGVREWKVKRRRTFLPSMGKGNNSSKRRGFFLHLDVVRKIGSDDIRPWALCFVMMVVWAAATLAPPPPPPSYIRRRRCFFAVRDRTCKPQFLCARCCQQSSSRVERLWRPPSPPPLTAGAATAATTPHK